MEHSWGSVVAVRARISRTIFIFIPSSRLFGNSAQSNSRSSCHHLTQMRCLRVLQNNLLKSCRTKRKGLADFVTTPRGSGNWMSEVVEWLIQLKGVTQGLPRVVFREGLQNCNGRWHQPKAAAFTAVKRRFGRKPKTLGYFFGAMQRTLPPR